MTAITLNSRLAGIVALGLLVTISANDVHAQSRQKEIANKLEEPFTNDRDFEGVPLEAALEVIGVRNEVTILVDEVSFRDLDPKSNILQEPVSLPGLRGVTLASALRIMLDPIDASVMVHRDYLYVVPRREAYRRTGLLKETRPAEDKSLQSKDKDDSLFGDENNGEKLPWLELVHIDVQEQPITRIIDDITRQAEVNILIHPEAKEKAEIPLTVKLYNAPPQTAARMLAEMAGLDVIEQGNTLLITTPERAKGWLEREKSRRMLKDDQVRS